MTARITLILFAALLSAAADSPPHPGGPGEFLENTGAEATSGTAFEPVSQDFRIGPGDVLAIEVWRESSISGRFTVGSDGRIEHPLLGSFRLANATVNEAAERLRRGLVEGLFLKNPRVSVQIADARSFQVSIVGAVRRPGLYYLRGPTDLMTLALLAGGFESGVPGKMTLLRARDEEVPEIHTVDLGDYLRTAGAGGVVRGEAGLRLQPGDLVYVAGATGEVPTPATGVTVVGEVKSPGVLALHKGDTLLSVILRAGGITDFASRSDTRIYRGGPGAKAIVVKLSDILDRGDRRKDVAIQAGDLVVVPLRHL